ncbi:gamma-glutamyl-gamma-aminobutyrate hydrolase family protein [Kitasatospora paracochleata]|uniref:Anthranilate synthase component 2/putative glutamine amidotransferase n=1 Tax=Kitasatospora paracochleata TaxID=58354 RepID=A0ABT1J1C0_9ACTN|nr:gamma-glutamyl-gamma-aminobutyrate hydrolase family protein [Kitasatospora paracochleata]MCP2311230.1 anthranilate synthase component 2/putative glutamine amidotransferase [Kitasatospora paracochleata]
MTNAPLIGITTYQEPAQWSVWQQPASLVPQTYVDAVARAGGIPVLLPPQAGGAERLAATLDGLVLAGGSDLDPARYGAEPHPRTGPPHRARDDWESALLTAALAADLPVLGVCRGMQLLNVALGGDLVQHLPDDSHQHVPARFVATAVRAADGSRLAGILGRSAKVNCYHHQAVGRLGDGLLPTAWSEDGTVEALELPGRRFVLGVQWHPETDPEDLRLFRALATAATAATTADQNARDAQGAA